MQYKKAYLFFIFLMSGISFLHSFDVESIGYDEETIFPSNGDLLRSVGYNAAYYPLIVPSKCIAGVCREAYDTTRFCVTNPRKIAGVTGQTIWGLVQKYSYGAYLAKKDMHVDRACATVVSDAAQCLIQSSGVPLEYAKPIVDTLVYVPAYRAVIKPNTTAVASYLYSRLLGNQEATKEVHIKCTQKIQQVKEKNYSYGCNLEKLYKTNSYNPAALSFIGNLPDTFIESLSEQKYSRWLAMQKHFLEPCGGAFLQHVQDKIEKQIAHTATACVCDGLAALGYMNLNEEAFSMLGSCADVVAASVGRDLVKPAVKCAIAAFVLSRESDEIKKKRNSLEEKIQRFSNDTALRVFYESNKSNKLVVEVVDSSSIAVDDEQQKLLDALLSKKQEVRREEKTPPTLLDQTKNVAWATGFSLMRSAGEFWTSEQAVM